MQSDRFGPYRLEAPLGRGATGEVFRALDTERDRVVALRLLPEALTADPGYRERFLSATARAAELDEPHVVPVHRAGELEGRLFVDMPLVPGRDLAAVLADEGPMEPSRAVALVGQAARALDAASAQDVEHPGLGPSDVLLTGSGDEEFVHLVGLGVPAAGGPSAAVGRDSVQALAGLLLACLTGRPAAASDGSPAARSADLPAALDEVVHRGLSGDPGDGYATCGELAAAAEGALHEDALHDPDPDPGRGMAGRLPLVLGAVAVAAVLAVALVLLLGRDDDPGTAAAPTSEQPLTTAPPPATADPAENALRAVIPGDFINVDCDTGEPTPDGALAVLGCGSAQSQPGPEDSVFYLYEDPAAADAVFLADVERNGVPPLPAGASCPATQGHTTYTRDDEQAGRVACYIDEDNDAIMIWTQEDSPVEGLVVIIDGGQPGLDALHAWWTESGWSTFPQR